MLETLRFWFADNYWYWRSAWAFRFYSYEDDIDRSAFFSWINVGWYEMCPPEEP